MLGHEIISRSGLGAAGQYIDDLFYSALSLTGAAFIVVIALLAFYMHRTLPQTRTR